MMRLFILGPAFGLPSIDAECIAAVALVKQRVREGEWTLIPTHDQTRRIPYLEAGDEYISGFENIVRYLDTKYPGSSPSLSATQRADSTAISSFLLTHAQILLDITLYVSASNYASTRTAFTAILPWHANYTLPPARQAAARKRTEHLGISSIDVDDVHEDLSNRPQSLAKDVGKEEKEFEPETQKRASMLLGGGRGTVRSLLRSRGEAGGAVFKLHALADNFFEPLQEMLGEKEYLLRTARPEGVDCLAYGFLGLMQFPDLEQDWLAKVLARKYPKLLGYLERLHKELDVATQLEDVMALSKCGTQEEAREQRRVCGMTLPWQPPAPSSLQDVAHTFSASLLSHLPPFLFSPTTLIPSNPQPVTAWKRYAPLALTLTASSLGLSLYYAFHTGLLVWPRGEEVHIFGRKRFSDFGHLGAALAGVSLLGQQAQGDMAYHQRDALRVGNVEVEVERDRR